jgi:uncharacterized protein (TIRG00374 family)
MVETVIKEAAKTSRKDRLLNLLRIFISLLLLAFIVIKNYKDFSEIYSAIAGISVLLIAVAVLTHLLMLWLESILWDVLLRGLDVKINRAYLFQAMMIAYFYNNLLPSNIGGDFFRVYDLAKNRGAPAAKCASAVFIQRFFGLITITIFFVATSFSIYRMLKNYVIVIAVFLGIAFVLFTLLAKPSLFKIDRMFLKFARIRKFWSKIQGFSDAVSSYKNRLPRLLLGLAINICCQMLFTVMFYFISISLGLDISFMTLAFMVPVIFVLIGIPISIGGLGVRENVIVFLLLSFGIANEKAVAFSLIVLFVHIFNAAIGGIVYLFRNIFYRSKGFI